MDVWGYTIAAYVLAALLYGGYLTALLAQRRAIRRRSR